MGRRITEGNQGIPCPGRNARPLMPDGGSTIFNASIVSIKGFPTVLFGQSEKPQQLCERTLRRKLPLVAMRGRKPCPSKISSECASR